MPDKRLICSCCRDIFREGDKGAVGSCRHLFHSRCLPEDGEAWCQGCQKMVFRLHKAVGGLHGPVGQQIAACEASGDNSDLRREIAKYEKEAADLAKVTAGINKRAEVLKEEGKKKRAELNREMQIKAEQDRNAMERRKEHERIDAELAAAKERYKSVCKNHVIDRFAAKFHEDEDEALEILMSGLRSASKEQRIEIMQQLFGLRQHQDEQYDQVRLELTREEQIGKSLQARTAQRKAQIENAMGDLPAQKRHFQRKAQIENNARIRNTDEGHEDLVFSGKVVAGSNLSVSSGLPTIPAKRKFNVGPGSGEVGSGSMAPPMGKSQKFSFLGQK